MIEKFVVVLPTDDRTLQERAHQLVKENGRRMPLQQLESELRRIFRFDINPCLVLDQTSPFLKQYQSRGVIAYPLCGSDISLPQ